MAQPPGKPWSLTPEIESRIFELRRLGLPVVEIANRVEFSTDTVYKVLRNKDTLRDRQRNQRIDRVIPLRHQGYSPKAISDMTGLTPGQVNTAIKHYEQWGLRGTED